MQPAHLAQLETKSDFPLGRWSHERPDVCPGLLDTLVQTPLWTGLPLALRVPLGFGVTSLRDFAELLLRLAFQYSDGPHRFSLMIDSPRSQRLAVPIASTPRGFVLDP